MFSKNNNEIEIKFSKFYEEFFDSISNSKDADVILAKKYITKNIVPQRTPHKTVKDFLKELLFILYAEIPIQGYYKEYLDYTSTEKVGWFHMICSYKNMCFLIIYLILLEIL